MGGGGVLQTPFPGLSSQSSRGVFVGRWAVHPQHQHQPEQRHQRQDMDAFTVRVEITALYITRNTRNSHPQRSGGWDERSGKVMAALP